MSPKAFQKIVYEYYASHGRHTLPWRKTTNPYRILVSESMLQQTQVDRVVPKYKAFIKQFPTVRSLAEAKTADVLKLWSGLGYNRRALNLKRAAEEIVARHGAAVPRESDALIALSGIGPYTASAIRTFAYNLPEVVIETNIRAVFIHHFFVSSKDKVSDDQLIPYIQKYLDRENPRLWYSALMDYGTYLKRTYPNPTRQSVYHAKQSTFAGSRRQVRGVILKTLTVHQSLTVGTLARMLDKKSIDLKQYLAELSDEGFLVVEKNIVRLVY